MAFAQREHANLLQIPAPRKKREKEKKNANEKRKDMQISSSGPIDADLEEKKIFRREQLENETFKDRNMFFHTSHQGSHQGCWGFSFLF